MCSFCSNSFVDHSKIERSERKTKQLRSFSHFSWIKSSSYNTLHLSFNPYPAGTESDMSLPAGSILFTDQLHILIIMISLKMTMDSSKNGSWVILSKKFSWLKGIQIRRCSEIKSHEEYPIKHTKMSVFEITIYIPIE